MPVKAVRKLVGEYNSIQTEINKYVEKEQLLKDEHINFWKQLQEECDNQEHYKPDLSHKDSFTKMFYHTDGYDCPYCGIHLGGYPSSWLDWGVSADNNFYAEPNTFEWKQYIKYTQFWLGQDTSGWPLNKKELFQKGKSELEQYIAQITELESELSTLRKKRLDIYKKLKEIWKLCEGVLSIAEKRVSEVEKRIPRSKPYRMPDDFSEDYWGL